MMQCNIYEGVMFREGVDMNCPFTVWWRDPWRLRRKRNGPSTRGAMLRPSYWGHQGFGIATEARHNKPHC